MKQSLVILAMLAASSGAFAASHSYVSENYTCAQLQSVTRAHGEIRIHHWLGSNVYYSNADACTYNYMRPVPAYERSRDKVFCFVGYACQEEEGHGGR